MVSKLTVLGAYEDLFILVGQTLHCLWRCMTSGVSFQHSASQLPLSGPHEVLPWPWTVKSWRSSFEKYPQKLLGPTLCYSGLQIPGISAIQNSHLLFFSSVKLQFYLGRKSPHSLAESQARPRAQLLCFPALKAHSPALPVAQCLKTAALCVLSSFIVL